MPVHVAIGLTPAQAKAYRIADNRTNEEAEWDLDLLKIELDELQSLDFDLNLTAFDGKELKKLLAEPGSEGGGDTSPQLAGMKYQIVIECDDEDAQVAMIERLEQLEIPCRALIS